MENYIVTSADKKTKIQANSEDEALRKWIKTLKDSDPITLITGVMKEGGVEYEDELLYHFDYLDNNGYLDGFTIEYK